MVVQVHHLPVETAVAVVLTLAALTAGFPIPLIHLLLEVPDRTQLGIQVQGSLKEPPLAVAVLAALALLPITVVTVVLGPEVEAVEAVVEERLALVVMATTAQMPLVARAALEGQATVLEMAAAATVVIIAQAMARMALLQAEVAELEVTMDHLALLTALELLAKAS